MKIINITEINKKKYNEIVSHPLQSFEWGEFRKKTGIKVIRRGFLEKEGLIAGFQLTIHRIPHTSWNIGYVPKCTFLSKEVLDELKNIGQMEKCVFIQLEPNVVRHSGLSIPLIPSSHPLFTKYTLLLDLTKTENEIISSFHSKTRYNIRVAERNGVCVFEEKSEKAFETYLQLTKETTKRQGFFSHTEDYHRLMWNTLKNQKSNVAKDNNLSAHLLVAKYNEKILTTWILFVFKDTLYYPYGASSSENKEVMANNLIMWEAIKYGKKLGLKRFDMWGALGPNPDPKNPWYGFHRFKQGYNPKLIEFAGSYDLVINPVLYQLYKIADKMRWFYLKLFK